MLNIQHLRFFLSEVEFFYILKLEKSAQNGT